MVKKKKKIQVYTGLIQCGGSVAAAWAGL